MGREVAIHFPTHYGIDLGESIVKVRDLRAGMRFTIDNIGTGTFIALCKHPVLGEFHLVIWRLQGSGYSFDCLSYNQELQGRLIDESTEVRIQNFWSAVRGQKAS